MKARGAADAPDALLPQPRVRRGERGLAASCTSACSVSTLPLDQFYQTAQGYPPLEAGLLLLPWTAMDLFVAPLSGALSDRIGGRPLLAGGLALQAAALAWMAAVSTETMGYESLVAPFVLSGIGMGMFFAAVANVVLSAVRPEEEGKASGANNAIREVGDVLGVAVLASIFGGAGGYQTPSTFIDGLVPALWVGAAVVAVGSVLGALIPRKPRAERVPSGSEELVAQAETA